MPQPLGFYAGELFERADSFLSAFRVLTDKLDDGLAYPSYYLFAHALELYLKSFLAASDQPKSRLKALGHRLPDLLAECNKYGLPPVADLSACVGNLSEMTSDHDLRYPSGYIITLPDSALFLRISADLRAGIERFVRGAYIRATVQFAADTRQHRGQLVEWSD